MILSDGAELEAESSAPVKPNVPLLVIAHPHPKMGGDMHNKVVDQLFRRSAEKGWGAVRFNFRGVGGSTGTYDGGTGETNDLLAAVGWAARNFGRGAGEITLAGYSFGSWIAAKAAARLPELQQLILIAPPLSVQDFSVLSDLRHPKRIFAAGRDEFAPRERMEEWFAALTPPKSIRVLEDADHNFTGHTVRLIQNILAPLA